MGVFGAEFNPVLADADGMSRKRQFRLMRLDMERVKNAGSIEFALTHIGWKKCIILICGVKRSVTINHHSMTAAPQVSPAPNTTKRIRSPR